MDADRQRAIRLSRKTNSLCYDCGSRIETVGRSRCDSCFLIKQSSDRAFRQYRKDNRLCVRCGSSDIVTPGNAGRCADCYFRDTAKKVVMRTGKDIDWKDIRRIWLDQDGMCAITGFRLTPGLDAELDHIIPVSRCSDPNSIGNLRWVYYRVNHAKYDMTDGEFAEFIDDLHRCLHKNDSVK